MGALGLLVVGSMCPILSYSATPFFRIDSLCSIIGHRSTQASQFESHVNGMGLGSGFLRDRGP